MGGLNLRLGPPASPISIAVTRATMRLSGREVGLDNEVGPTGLLFPGNDDADGLVQLRLVGANYPGIEPLSVGVQINCSQHDGYYTAYFVGRTDGGFSGDETYYGCHGYPNPPPDGSVHNWEISIDGGDIIVDDNSNNTTVVYDQFFSQFGISGGSDVKFYWDLPNTNRIISYDQASPLQDSANSPGVVFGDATWNPNNERLNGVLRGIQIYTTALSAVHAAALGQLQTDAAVLAYCTANSLTSALWYLCMNPTPTDVTDKSGKGHHATWANANRPQLWTA